MYNERNTAANGKLTAALPQIGRACLPSLFTYGRRSAAEGLRSGKLKAAGETKLLDRFEEWFKGL